MDEPNLEIFDIIRNAYTSLKKKDSNNSLLKFIKPMNNGEDIIYVDFKNQDEFNKQFPQEHLLSNGEMEFSPEYQITEYAKALVNAANKDYQSKTW